MDSFCTDGVQNAYTRFNFLLYGRDIVLPYDKILKPQVVKYDVSENYASEMLGRLRDACDSVCRNLARSETRVKYYNRRTREKIFEVGDLVYLRDDTTKAGLTKKLGGYWIGPYRILEQKGPVTYKIRQLGSRKDSVVHVNRLKPFRGTVADPHTIVNEQTADELIHTCDGRGYTSQDDEDSDTGNPTDVADPFAWELQAATAAAAQAHELGRPGAEAVPQERQQRAAPAPDPEDRPLPRKSTIELSCHLVIQKKVKESFI